MAMGGFLGVFISELSSSGNQPFFGNGVGMGTNVRATFLTENKAFFICRRKWGRLIGELGPLMGLTVVLIRVTHTLKLLSQVLENI